MNPYSQTSTSFTCIAPSVRTRSHDNGPTTCQHSWLCLWMAHMNYSILYLYQKPSIHESSLFQLQISFYSMCQPRPTHQGLRSIQKTIFVHFQSSISTWINGSQKQHNADHHISLKIVTISTCSIWFPNHEYVPMLNDLHSAIPEDNLDQHCFDKC